MACRFSSVDHPFPAPQSRGFFCPGVRR
ncbi:hypothetical protein OH693_23425 [Escherichia coli]|nr:hypothetical protein [Escherichia coli]